MKIMLEGYFDCNFGDDMMFRIAADQLSEYDFYLKGIDVKTFIPFENIKNINLITEKTPRIDCKLKITGSGFLVNNKIALKYACAYYIRDIFKIRKIPRAVIGCNIEPFYNKLAEFIMNERIRENDFVTVRDNYSLNYIKKICNKNNIYEYPDIVFGIKDEWLFENTGEDLLGISVCKRYKTDIYEKNIAAAADKYISEMKKKVLFFAFDTGIENDEAECKRIISKMKYKDMTEIILHNDNGDNILKSYARCSLILGTRFHSIVLAMRMKIPFIPLWYDGKTKNMLKTMGYKGSLYNIADEFSLMGNDFYVDNETIKKARCHTKKFREWVEKNYD